MDILTLKQTSFVLWLPTTPAHPPVLVIGTFTTGNPPTVTAVNRFNLTLAAGSQDIWEIPAASCGLVAGSVYHYWFEVNDTKPGRPGARMLVTDPFAYSVDWRALADQPAGPYEYEDRYPAAVVKYLNGQLIAADPGGETPEPIAPVAADALPANHRLVIYELPTAWMRIGSGGNKERGVGTFRDITALVENAEGGANFDDLPVLAPGRSYLQELGVNALELLPPADSILDRQWGYGTTNFLAPDYELGFPQGFASPTPNQDLSVLVNSCHTHGIRVLVDVVMGFARNHAYLAASCPEFFILEPLHASDPDAHDSRGGLRGSWGSTLLRYVRHSNNTDPLTGTVANISLARQLLKTSLLRWMKDFGVDGYRIDSVETVANWDFIQEFKDLARATHRARFTAAQGNEADQRFLVVGEELWEPLALLSQHRLDGMWRPNFRDYIRPALLGRNHKDESSFEWTVRKAIDCRNMGYQDLAQAVIYLTSHDVEGAGNERLFNYFKYSSVYPAEPRIKLAFACLLTAVGIPMILAGDEFADEHDLLDAAGHVTNNAGKQVDPVNFSRLQDDWRTRIKVYVSRLIKLRTSYPALGRNDTDFIHVDFNDGKRVLVWRRGAAGSDSQVVVVANFSDYGTPNPTSPSAEYVVHNWPALAPGKKWREVTQDRDVPLAWAGREPLYPWEAKVYAMV